MSFRKFYSYKNVQRPVHVNMFTQEKEAKTGIRVEARPQNASLSCPANTATYEETLCVLEVMGGTNLQLTVRLDGIQHSQFYISGK